MIKVNDDSLAHLNEQSQARYSKTILRRLSIVKAHFFNPGLRVGVQINRKSLSCEYEDIDALIVAHLEGHNAKPTSVRLGNRRESGQFRIGFYSQDSDGNTKWLCLDLDGAGHKQPLADAEAVAKMIVLKFRTSGIPAYAERSGGGHGWHVWVFFASPIPIRKARALGLLFAPKDAALKNGGLARPEANEGIEVFPKQFDATNSMGNYVWLPWWYGAPEGANKFYELRDDGAFHMEALDV